MVSPKQDRREGIRKGIGKQLGYLRNLQTISALTGKGLLAHLESAQYREVLIINKLHR